MMRITIFALAIVTLTGAANADHRWRKQRYIANPLDIITSAIDPSYDEEVWLEDEEEDDEPTLNDMRKRRKNWARDDDELWWLEDEADVPVKKPAKKKTVAPKKTVATTVVPPKPRAKPVNTAAIVAAPKSKPVAAKTLPKLPAKIQNASVSPKATPGAPKPTGKTVGCTGGAAIVTGLGFADVRPRVCTGNTYAYLAAKADGTYAIKLKASTGEVVDVAKLP